jgi:hypothetical protein
MEVTGKRMNIYEKSELYNRSCNQSVAICATLQAKHLGISAFENVLNDSSVSYYGGGASYIDQKFSFFTLTDQMINEVGNNVKNLTASFYFRKDMLQIGKKNIFV